MKKLLLNKAIDTFFVKREVVTILPLFPPILSFYSIFLAWFF